MIEDPFVNVQHHDPVDAQARQRRRRGLFWLLMGCAALITLSAGGWLVHLAMSGELRAMIEEAQEASDEKGPMATPDDAVAPDDDDDSNPVDDEDTDLGRASPDDTEERKLGDITVVDIGRGVATLRDTLQMQHRLARRQKQTLLVMITARQCDPCRGVDNALADERMQEALENVRLVRINRGVFVEELNQLKIPHNVFPGFFLLNSEAEPMDGIHGGEWDADIPENIAPVLGPFVRGHYSKRRHQWSPTTDGVQL